MWWPFFRIIIFTIVVIILAGFSVNYIWPFVLKIVRSGQQEVEVEEEENQQRPQQNNDIWKQRINLIKNIFAYGIIFTFIGFILFVVFLIAILPTPSDDQIKALYQHLLSPVEKKYKQRVLDEGDSMPEVYCVQNTSEVLKILKDKERIYEMINALAISKLPCISSYHFKKENETRVPHFILLNKRFHTVNYIGKVTDFISSVAGIKDNIYVQFFIRAYGTTFHQGEHYYIFNPRIVGHSKKKNENVERTTSLCRWTRPKKKLMYFSIQIEALEAIFHDNKIYIEDSILKFNGEYAYCTQYNIEDIKKEGSLICDDP